MKIENFDKVKDIVNQIQLEEDILKDLRQPLVTVVIYSNSHTGLIMTIGAYSSCEHSYKSEAMLFVESIQMHTLNRINQLKQKLEEL